MRIESVRSLKSELLTTLQQSEVLKPRLARAVAGRAWSMAGGPRSAPRRTAFAESLDAVHVRTPGRVSLGIARGSGRRDYRMGVRVHAAGSAGRRLASLCLEASRGEADVRIVPRVVAGPPSPQRASRARGAESGGAWFRSRRRPLEAGLSVGHHRITAGTLGFIVEDADAYYTLSNNHVLADINAGSPGDLIVQPGPMDRGTLLSAGIGVLDRYVPISFSRSNVVDCAIASLFDEQDFYAGWTEALPGVVRGARAITEDDLGRAVSKAGRTTGVTHGVISQVEIDRLRVDMGEEGRPREASFSDQFEVEGEDRRPFSLGGDSGSVIVDQDHWAIGLLFAGGADDAGVDLTYANRLDTALAKLGVRLTL